MVVVTRTNITITIIMEAVMATKTTKEIITAKVIAVYGTDTNQVGGILRIACDRDWFPGSH
jgi:hypothetical protein